MAVGFSDTCQTLILPTVNQIYAEIHQKFLSAHLKVRDCMY